MTQPYHLLPRLSSSLADEWLDVGLNHQVAGRYAEAEVSYLKGLRVDPNNGPIIANLGIMAAQQSNVMLAIQRLERALLFDEVNATTWYNYALALLEGERADESIVAIDKSLAIMESADALTVKAMILTSLAKAAEASECYERALEKNPNHTLAAFNSIFVKTLKNSTPEDNFKARRRWHENFKYKGTVKPFDNDRAPDRKLRIGYVGGDFKMHSAAFIFGTIILNHDRELVDPYCYMSLPSEPDKDEQTKNFMAKTIWRDISAKSDDEAEAMIREDKIDILVDLAGHTGGNRLSLFTRQCAPIQCHGWGFAHGTGCPEIDYFLADEYAIPQEERKFFAEKIWDLPCIVGYTPPGYNHAASSPPPVTRDGIFTFGVFGRFEKYSPQALEAWHKILLSVKDSRIVFKDLMMRRPYVIRHIRKAMHDIDPKRILFMQDNSHFDHMLFYQSADLVLDTFPHTGGVTALEIIYMGVPIVTLYNGQVGGRTTAAVLRAIGRQAWVGDSISDYVKKAVDLAADRQQLSAARGKLREELMQSVVCTGYAAQVDKAYREMWWRYCGVEKGRKRASS